MPPYRAARCPAEWRGGRQAGYLNGFTRRPAPASIPAATRRYRSCTDDATPLGRGGAPKDGGTAHSAPPSSPPTKSPQ